MILKSEPSLNQYVFRRQLSLFARDVLVPVLILLAVDFLLFPQWMPECLLSVVFAAPIYFKLYRQFKIWKHYAVRFGMPKLKTIRQILELSDSRSWSRSWIETSTQWLLVASLFGLASVFLSSWTLAYCSFLCTVYLIHRLARISRPPAILFLAASSYRADLLKIFLMAHVCKPFRCYYLLHPRVTLPTQSFERSMNYRTRDTYSWEITVETLMHASPIVILDVGNSTEAIQYELQLASEKPYAVKSYCILDSTSAFRLDDSERYSAVECLQEIAERCGNQLNASHQKILSKILE